MRRRVVKAQGFNQGTRKAICVYLDVAMFDELAAEAHLRAIPLAELLRELLSASRRANARPR